MTAESVDTQQGRDRMSDEVLVVGGRSRLKREDLRSSQSKLKKGTAKRVTFVLVFIAVIGGGYILLRGQWRRIIGGAVETLTNKGDTLPISQGVPSSLALSGSARLGHSESGDVPRLQNNDMASKHKINGGDTGPDQKKGAEEITLELLQQQTHILQLLSDKLKEKEQQQHGGDQHEEAKPPEQQEPHQQHHSEPTRRPEEHHQQPQPPGQRQQQPPAPAPQVPRAPVPKPFPEVPRAFGKPVYGGTPRPAVSSHKEQERTNVNHNIPASRQASKSTGYHRQSFMLPRAQHPQRSQLRKRAKHTDVSPKRRGLQGNTNKQKAPKQLDALAAFRNTHNRNNGWGLGLPKRITIDDTRTHEKSEIEKWAEEAARLWEKSKERETMKDASKTKDSKQKTQAKGAAKMFEESHHRSQYMNRQANRWRRARDV